MKDWTFVCLKCGETLELDESPDSAPRCCDEYMDRVFNAHKIINVGNKEYFHTKFSDSLAMAPSQIAEHKRLFPDIKVDSEGRPGFDSVRQHSDYLKKCGLHKEPQQIRKNKRAVR